ncbi:MAG TPA: glycosyltransferase [Blastocatellia bacterium]|nr:glycosyltransferase [Blastocatellia bacterium]
MTSSAIDRAYRLQRQGDLEAAAALYRDALAERPDHPDCLHMLGVVYLRQKRYLEGVDCIEQACVATEWRYKSCILNLLRGLEQLVATLPEAASGVAQKRLVMAERARQAASRLSDPTPLVSVLIPAYNHAPFIRAALRSAIAQTYPQVEIIVIDDGSTDSTPTIIRDELSRCSIPSRFISRENRGAAATINECIALASGRYVNALNSDDLFAPNRIQEMVQAVHRGGADWGFSGCKIIDDNGRPVADDHRAGKIRAHFSGLEDLEHTSHHFLLGNPAVSTGNIFASKELVARIGGFSDLRYNHDWAFCLAAIWLSEPVMVPSELYEYRLHRGNTISERGGGLRPAEEADAIVSEYCRRAETDTPINPLALCKTSYPAKLTLAKLRHTRFKPSSSERIRGLIREIRDQYLTTRPLRDN